MKSENSLIDKLNSLIKTSVTLKLATITILMVLLLIPASMVKSIIQEREQLNAEVTHEIRAKWANEQQINGPILTIPLTYEFEKEDKKVTTTEFWHLLPQNLNIEGDVRPEILKRGMYEVIVYRSTLSISGDFYISPQPYPRHLKEIQYDRAFLTIGITDLKGIKKQINMNWNGKSLEVNPGSKLADLISSGITIDLPDLRERMNRKMAFDCSVILQGSKNLTFVPIGNTTKVRLKSPWTSPSFNGNFLPDNREISDQGFDASWSVLQLNRNYPQTWVGSHYQEQMKESSFGVDLILPLDDYQKSYRSAKYAAMTIALTFLIFFLVEILNKRKIHPFQYVLVGLALCLFYLLLVSISEHSNFNMAYGIAALAMIVMISLYSLSVFKKMDLFLLLVTTLSGIYGFLFVTLQLADYALLLGSIGLVVILGLTMYLTRNINWYDLNLRPE